MRHLRQSGSTLRRLKCVDWGKNRQMISLTSCGSDLIHFTRSSNIYLCIKSSYWSRQVIEALSLAKKCHTTCLGIKLEAQTFCQGFFGRGVVTNVFIIVICHGHIQNLYKMTKPSPYPPRYKGRGLPSVLCHTSQNSRDAAQRKCTFRAKLKAW